MFKLNQSDSFWWPVELELPADGKHAKHRFELQFKRLAQPELDKMLATVTADAAVCREVVLGWKGVQEDGGAEIQFSPAELNRLLDLPTASYTIASTFYDAMQGAARRKNLLGLRATGQ